VNAVFRCLRPLSQFRPYPILLRRMVCLLRACRPVHLTVCLCHVCRCLRVCCPNRCCMSRLTGSGVSASSSQSDVRIVRARTVNAVFALPASVVSVPTVSNTSASNGVSAARVSSGSFDSVPVSRLSLPSCLLSQSLLHESTDSIWCVCIVVSVRRPNRACSYCECCFRAACVRCLSSDRIQYFCVEWCVCCARVVRFIRQCACVTFVVAFVFAVSIAGA